MEKEKEKTAIYKPTEKERVRIKWLQDRYLEMNKAYKVKKLENLFNKLDKQYLPHKFTRPGLQEWQENSAKNIAFTKIQTAVAILIDQNPEHQFFAKTKKGEDKLPLWKRLKEHTDDVGNAKEQWENFIFDLSLYGTSIGQEYWRYETREVTIAGEKQTITDFNDPYWKELPIREVRLDEKAKSWNPKSEDYPRDWFRRTVVDFEDLERLYPASRYPDIKYVKSGGDIKNEKEMKSVIDVGKDQVEVLYGERWTHDECSLLMNGVLVKDIALPFKHKKLSIFGANFWKRSTDDIYGLGIPEVIEGDEKLIDKINCTNADQILLDIYKVLVVGMGEEIEDEEMVLEPNKVLHLKNPDVAKWLTSGEKAGNTKHDASALIETKKDDIDEKTGITKQLAGALMGKTATETAINREAGLRRMKTPLNYIESAMDWQAKLRIAGIKQVYELPTGERKAPVPGLRGLVMSKKIPTYRELRLNVKAKKGIFQESDRPEYLEITPVLLFEEPDIRIKHMSTIPVSKALEEQRVLQTFSIVSNLPYTDIHKAQTKLLKARGEDPEEWMMTEENIMNMQEQAKGFTTGQGQEGQGKPVEREAKGTEEGIASVPIQQKKSGVFSKTMEKIGGLMGK